MRLAPDDSTLLDFGHEFLVVCPRCQQQALVSDRGPSVAPRIALACRHCGQSQYWQAAGPGMLTSADTGSYPPGQAAMGGPVDWYFHLPLWLQTACRGETLWAYNARHLDFIAAYVRATLRERARGQHGWSSQALRNRLPGWIKAARARRDILRCIEQLRQRL